MHDFHPATAKNFMELSLIHLLVIKGLCAAGPASKMRLLRHFR